MARKLDDLAGKEKSAFRPFQNDDEVISSMLKLIAGLTEREGMDYRHASAELSGNIKRQLRHQRKMIHKKLRASTETSSLAELFVRLDLSNVECEIVLTLLLSRLSLLELRPDTPRDILKALMIQPSRTLATLRLFDDDGKLFTNGLITYQDLEEDLPSRTLSLDPMLVQKTLRGKHRLSNVLTFENEKEFLDALHPLVVAFDRRRDAMRDMQRNTWMSSEPYFRAHSTASRLFDQAVETLGLHPDWKIYRLIIGDETEGYTPQSQEQAILMLLVGRELGYLPHDSDTFTSEGLAMAVSRAVPAIQRTMEQYFGPDSALVTGGYIEPVSGDRSQLTSDPEALKEVGFALAERSLQILDLPVSKVKFSNTGNDLREPRLMLKDLFFEEELKEQLQSAIVQERVGLVGWVGDRIKYGAGLVILFFGPPGTGKTACAEAFAHELGRPLLVVNYAHLFNCYVGNTEKRIDSVFREAQRVKAVLFFDEIDALLPKRDALAGNSGQHTIRFVNVMLASLEQCEAPVILATNRKDSLDDALMRRVGIKIQFTIPSRVAREKILRHLSAGMPLAADIDYSRLAGLADFSGGELKNIVLNAARFALVRGQDLDTKVSMLDFVKACEAERRTWNLSADTTPDQRCSRLL